MEIPMGTAVLGLECGMFADSCHNLSLHSPSHRLFLATRQNIELMFSCEFLLGVLHVVSSILLSFLVVG